MMNIRLSKKVVTAAIYLITLAAFTYLDWLVINADWHKDWHEVLGFPIYHYAYWVIPALVVFRLFWKSENGFIFNLFICGAWLAAFAVLEDLFYLSFYGIANGAYPYPQGSWQEAYYGWFGKVIGHEWWFGMPSGYFLGAVFLGIVYFVRLIVPDTQARPDKPKNKRAIIQHKREQCLERYF